MIQKINDILIEFTDKLGWNTNELKQDDKAYNMCEAKLCRLFESEVKKIEKSAKE